MQCDQADTGREPAATTHTNVKPYSPSATDREVLLAVAAQLTALLGSEVVNPIARIAMIAESSTETEAQTGCSTVAQRIDGRQLEVALYDETTAPLLTNIGAFLLFAPLFLSMVAVSLRMLHSSETACTCKTAV